MIRQPVTGLDAVLSEGRLGPRWLYPAIAAILVGAFLLQSLLSMRTMSLVGDEPIYITSGYTYWTTRDGRLNLEHPPLLKMLIATPLLPLHLSVPTDNQAWRDGNEWGFFATFLYNDLGTVEQIMLRSRLSNVFLGVLLAVFVRKWAAELWGADAGLIALLMFVFEPNILAHVSLATLDFGLTAFTFISMYYVWKWLATGRTAYARLASVVLGFSFLSKFTALAFLLIYLGQFVLEHVAANRDGSPGRIAPLASFLRLLAGGLLVVIAFYAVMFHWHPLLRAGGEHRTVTKIMTRVPGLPRGAQARIVALGEHVPIPDVGTFIRGILYQRAHLRDPEPAFLMGRHSVHGWWYYYPVAFLIKTPLPILLLLIFRLVRLRAVPMVTGEYVVVLPIVGVMLLALLDTLDLGIRYLLPLYPFLFVWLSRIVALEGLSRPRMQPSPVG